MSLTNRILIAMVAGIALGSLLNLLAHSGAAPESVQAVLDDVLVDGVFDVVGRIFVASLKLLVVPLVLVSLICGSSSLGDSARMGPIAVKTLCFYLATTAIAVSLALLAAVVIGPGSHVELGGDYTYEASAAPPLVVRGVTGSGTDTASMRRMSQAKRMPSHSVMSSRMR